jgi:hypothetical protein
VQQAAASEERSFRRSRDVHFATQSDAQSAERARVSDDRAQLLRSAEQLNEAQYREEFEERLDVLETLIRDAWMLSLGVEPARL